VRVCADAAIPPVQVDAYVRRALLFNSPVTTTVLSSIALTPLEFRQRVAVTLASGEEVPPTEPCHSVSLRVPMIPQSFLTSLSVV
jgi:hypothetical protein